MYKVIKTLEISACHHLELSYASKCHHMHGHNWIITVECQAEHLNNDGMVYDFTHIKRAIQEKLDHQNLNDVLSFNPTAENIAYWTACQIGPTCKSVTVQESKGNVAKYEV